MQKGEKERDVSRARCAKRRRSGRSGKHVDSRRIPSSRRFLRRRNNVVRIVVVGCQENNGGAKERHERALGKTETLLEKCVTRDRAEYKSARYRTSRCENEQYDRE